MAAFFYLSPRARMVAIFYIFMLLSVMVPTPSVFPSGLVLASKEPTAKSAVKPADLSNDDLDIDDEQGLNSLPSDDNKNPQILKGDVLDPEKIKKISEEISKLREGLKHIRPTETWKPFGEKFSAGTFFEQFNSKDFTSLGWVMSKAPRNKADPESSYKGSWKIKEPHVQVGSLAGDLGLTLMDKAQHHAISILITPKPFDFKKTTPFIVQYEVKFMDGLTCSGAYMKLASATNEEGVAFSTDQFSNDTPYTIMFGPDRCGSTKLHFILRHRNPKTGKVVEHHCKNCSVPSDVSIDSKHTHLYTLILDSAKLTYTVLVDNKDAGSGSLLSTDNFDPPLLPPKKVPDASASKPEEWDDRETIPDPDPKNYSEDVPARIPDPKATMPSDWLVNEEPTIPNPDAKRPNDWDDENDGTWAAPLIDNPNCKTSKCGKWEPPLIANPEYRKRQNIKNPDFKGVWKLPEIDNPDYYTAEELGSFTPIAGVGFELWTMDKEIHFDNILVSNMITKEKAHEIAEATWGKKNLVENKYDEIERKISDLEKEKNPDKPDPEKSTSFLNKKNLLASLMSIGFWREQFSLTNLVAFAKLLVESPTRTWELYPGLVGATVAVATILLMLILSSLFSSGSSRKKDVSEKTENPSAPQKATKKASRSPSPDNGPDKYSANSDDGKKERSDDDYQADNNDDDVDDDDDDVQNSTKRGKTTGSRTTATTAKSRKSKT